MGTFITLMISGNKGLISFPIVMLATIFFMTVFFFVCFESFFSELSSARSSWILPIVCKKRKIIVRRVELGLTMGEELNSGDEELNSASSRSLKTRLWSSSGQQK